MEEKKSTWKRIQEKQLERKMIYILMFIVLVIPVVRPLGLPLPISDMTRESYQAVENVPSGSSVMIPVYISIGLWPEVEPGTIVMLKHLLRKPVKFMIVCWAADEPKLMEGALAKVADFARENNKKYGVDYVNLGFIPGMETAMAAFAKDVPATAPADTYGTPISQLPAMSGIKTAKDFALILYITGSDVAAMIRQYVSAYGSKMVAFATIGWVPSFTPYLSSGQLVGLVPGVTGGAQYELLMKSPGAGLATTDALSLGFIYLVILAILGNIMWQYTERPSLRTKTSKEMS